VIFKVSYFYKPQFLAEYLFQERCILMERMMVLVLKNIKSPSIQYGKRSGNFIYNVSSRKIFTYDGDHLPILSGCHFIRKHLKNYFYTNGVMPRVKIKKKPRICFHVETLYYRFMDAFKKKMLLFLLTLAASKFLSMLNWLIDFKFMHRIFKEHKLRVKMFKFLNIRAQYG
jgi:hypothetical protein